MSVAVITFPGSNCDRDCVHAIGEAVGAQATRAWHKDIDLPSETTAVILPGGFSYGDYLRTAAIAARESFQVSSASSSFSESTAESAVTVSASSSVPLKAPRLATMS